VIDETSRELLSRLLDGDLDPDRARSVSERCRTEPDLAAELEGMRRVRDAVSRLSAEAQPPRELDRLMEPLRRGAPMPSGPTWLRGLAAAAAVVLGFAVAVEVIRHTHPEDGGAIRKLRQTTPTDAPETREIYRLRPLPTSSVPEDDVALGLADRLAASPIPEPRLEDPPELDFVGPLAAEPEADGGSIDTEDTPDAFPRATLRIARPEGELSVAVRLTRGLAPGVYSLRIAVRHMTVQRIDADDGGDTDTLRSSLVGTSMEGLADGLYPAALIVPNR
jgi:hypothetical protein